MKCFLTSNPFNIDCTAINRANQLVGNLRRALPENCRTLFICSDPDDHDRTDFFAQAQKNCFENAGFPFSDFAVLDSRNASSAREIIFRSDFIILAGGHVPTQNHFFEAIDLRSLLKEFDGTLLGISAGTMNSAAIVYAHPELDGEAIDPHYKRFLRGLNLTTHMILPHYQEIKDDVLDGLRVFEDIAYPDSMGRQFYVLEDGSYILSCDGAETLYGKAFLLENGILRQISSEGDILSL